MSLKKYKFQGKAVDVAVNSKEENIKTFVLILSKNSASGPELSNTESVSDQISRCTFYSFWCLIPDPHLLS